MMTPVDIRPSPYVIQARHGSACIILPLFVTHFGVSLKQTLM